MSREKIQRVLCDDETIYVIGEQVFVVENGYLLEMGYFSKQTGEIYTFEGIKIGYTRAYKDDSILVSMEYFELGKVIGQSIREKHGEKEYEWYVNLPEIRNRLQLGLFAMGLITNTGNRCFLSAIEDGRNTDKELKCVMTNDNDLSALAAAFVCWQYWSDKAIYHSFFAD